jgi:glycolate oxidase FAD binding subunit
MTVLAPSSVSEVVALIGEARDSTQPLWFTGSGTTPVPDQHTIVSTKGLSGIVDYKPDDLTIVVRCGTTLGKLDETLKEYGHTAVLSETTPGRTVGGVVASGASGFRRLRYGPTRDRVIGVRFATGYGEVVSAGGQLVKNVTGYDVSRLMTGSHGALGFISEVSLKLWPVPYAPRTVQVDDPASVRMALYRPVAALETESGGFVYVSGDSRLEGPTTAGYVWPSPLEESVVAVLNVPARLVPEAIGRIRDFGAERFVAQHGVGAVEVGWSDIGESQIIDLRSWAESRGGTLVLHRRGPLSHTVSRWGAAPQTIHIQRRLKTLFDPDGVCNPGVLPGGV